MPADLTPGDRDAIESLVGRLEAAWKAMDGSAFAAPFAVDADFVTSAANASADGLLSPLGMQRFSGRSTPGAPPS